MRCIRLSKAILFFEPKEAKPPGAAEAGPAAQSRAGGGRGRALGRSLPLRPRRRARLWSSLFPRAFGPQSSPAVGRGKLREG